MPNVALGSYGVGMASQHGTIARRRKKINGNRSIGKRSRLREKVGFVSLALRIMEDLKFGWGIL